jgi:molybdopterin-binding protein
MQRRAKKPRKDGVRIGAAAELLGISIDTVRRWEAAGRLTVRRSAGGHRLVSLAELRRLQGERRARSREPRIVAQSARNRFAGIVTRVVKDKVAAQVEIQAGPHRVVSLMTREAADELGLEPGALTVAAVKATNVVIEVPQE